MTGKLKLGHKRVSVYRIYHFVWCDKMQINVDKTIFIKMDAELILWFVCYPLLLNSKYVCFVEYSDYICYIYFIFIKRDGNNLAQPFLNEYQCNHNGNCDVFAAQCIENIRSSHLVR